MDDPPAAGTPENAPPADDVPCLRLAVECLEAHHHQLLVASKYEEKKAGLCFVAFVVLSLALPGPALGSISRWVWLLALLASTVTTFLAVMLQRDPKPNPASTWRAALASGSEREMLAVRSEHLSRQIDIRSKALLRRSYWGAWTLLAATIGMASLVVHLMAAAKG